MLAIQVPEKVFDELPSERRIRFRDLDVSPPTPERSKSPESSAETNDAMVGLGIEIERSVDTVHSLSHLPQPRYAPGPCVLLDILYCAKRPISPSYRHVLCMLSP
jgi:hypothetical protein